MQEEKMKKSPKQLLNLSSLKKTATRASVRSFAITSSCRFHHQISKVKIGLNSSSNQWIHSIFDFKFQPTKRCLHSAVTSTPYLPRLKAEEQFFDAIKSSAEQKVLEEGKTSTRSGILLLGPHGCGMSTFSRKMAEKLREQDNQVVENDGKHTVVIEFGSCKEWVSTFVANKPSQRAACIYYIQTMLRQLESEHNRYKSKLALLEQQNPQQKTNEPMAKSETSEEKEDEEDEQPSVTGLRAAVQVLEAWTEFLQELYNVKDELSDKDISSSLGKFTNLLAQNTYMKTVIFYDDYEYIFHQLRNNRCYFTVYPFFEAIKNSGMYKNVETVFCAEEDTNLFKYTNTYRGKSKHHLIKLGRFNNEELDQFLESYRRFNDNPLLNHREEIKKITNNFIGDVVNLLNNYTSFEAYANDCKKMYEERLVKLLFEERLKQVRVIREQQRQKDLLQPEFSSISIEDSPFMIGGLTFNNQEEVTMCLDSDRLGYYNNAFDWYLSREDLADKFSSSFMESTLLECSMWYRITNEKGTKFKFRNPIAERVFKQNLANHLYGTKFSLHSVRSDRIMSIWSTKTAFPKRRQALVMELLARFLEDQSQIIGTVQYTAAKKMEIIKKKQQEKENKKPKSQIDALLEQEPTLDMKGLSIRLNQPSPLISFFGRNLDNFETGSNYSFKDGNPPFDVHIHEVANDAQVGELIANISNGDDLSAINVVYPRYSIYNDIDVVAFTRNVQNPTQLDVFTIKVVEGNGYGKRHVEFQDVDTVKQYASTIKSLKPKGIETINHHFALFALEKTHTNVKNYKLSMPEELVADLPKVTISYVKDFFTEDTERIEDYAEYLKQLEEELQREQNDELNFGDQNTVEAMVSQMGHKDMAWFDKVDI